MPQPPRRLATFVQVSDLHFGDIDLNAPYPDAVVRSFWRLGNVFDGLFGHHYVAIAQLNDFFLGLQQERPSLIVTGDLTRVGTQDQFDTAGDYFGRILQPPKGRYVGLQVPGWQQCAIPGNHDHWPGRASIWGRPTPALAMCFPVMPYVGPARLLGQSGIWLRIIGINTDAQVNPDPLSRQRFLARGVFQKELQDAANLLPGQKPQNEIRVLLLHHSHAHRGRTLAMENSSRDALEEFLVAYEIPVILSGHVHYPHVAMFTATHPTMHLRRTVLEGRCGTTCQRDNIPLTWRDLAGRRPRNRTLYLNTLLVHRLQWDGKVMTWHAQTYRRSPRGFILPDAQNPLPASWRHEESFIVWPWP